MTENRKNQVNVKVIKCSLLRSSESAILECAVPDTPRLYNDQSLVRVAGKFTQLVLTGHWEPPRDVVLLVEASRALSLTNPTCPPNSHFFSLLLQNSTSTIKATRPQTSVQTCLKRFKTTNLAVLLLHQKQVQLFKPGQIHYRVSPRFSRYLRLFFF